ncbi:MAG: hypothetical protein GXO63_02570, partial [Candidatus Micrarchaeota archaeon]|nr:hypothetical protein [Candidatus Micrarchaeota archaeon]
MFFRDKKKEYEKRLEKIRKEQIRKVLREIKPGIELPKEEFQPYSSDYRQFLREIKREPRSLFEKLCRLFEKIGVEPDPKTRAKLENEIESAYLNVTPKGVMSLATAAMGIGMFLSFFLLFTGAVGPLFFLVLLLISLILGYGIYSYPSYRANVVQVRMASDMVLAVLYMVIYMRNSPQLEGAIRFAAENLTGPLSWDLKKLLWDVEVGVYDSVDQAVVAYLTRWKDRVEEFSEALHLLRNSTLESGERRNIVLDEAINVILNGTRERMKHYAMKLRLPVMLIHAIGVLLPIIGLVMLPVVVLFMSEQVKPVFIFLGYDLVLPLFLLWYMNHILKTKPPTFSQPDVSQAKDVPPMGKFRLGKVSLPVWPFALMVSLPVVLFGFTGIGRPETFQAVFYSVIIVSGIGLGIFIYCLLDSFQKMKVRKDVEKIEREFSEALFQLGNQIAGGIPVEVAVDRAWENLRNLKISELFLQVSVNMKKLGMTFSQALFDKNYGAVWRFPSRLIRSVMQVIVESSKKGVHVASMSMLTVSRYLKGVHNVKEEILEMLNETTTSMRFLAMFLAPLISGIVV